jgi:putative transposase
MKLTLQLKLLPTTNQADALLDTMRRFNEAATFAALQGFAAGVFSKPSMQKLAYRECRDRFGLSAQMAVRAIAKAAEAFSSCGKDTCPVFCPDGAMTYDERILSFKDCHRVSILAVGAGRLMIPYVFGEYQAANLARIRGQADLVYRGGKFFLYCTIEFQEAPPVLVKDFLGVDLGIVSIAVDSEGESHTGAIVDRNRKRRSTARKQHQRKGTTRARRKLKDMAGRQRRFQANQNHRISKRIVAKAKTLGMGIALENLNGIRGRVETTVGKRFRRQFGNWGFQQLRGFIEYKARRDGVPIVFVDPRHTSRTCSACGHCAKANRKSQGSFVCVHCGYSTNADLNAARNISELGPSCKLAPKVAAPASGKAAGL